MRKILLIALFMGLVFPAFAQNAAPAAADTTSALSDIVLPPTADKIVIQSNLMFDQEAITIKAGQSIDFENKDDVTHNLHIIKEDGSNIDKGLEKPGRGIMIFFDKSGEYKIYCAIHPQMKMTVTVQ